MELHEVWDRISSTIIQLFQRRPLKENELGVLQEHAKGESVRSLSLLAFRNIVVLKVGTRDALDNVAKQSYPASIHQMLLVLQGVQDNVFLSENQFLLEKLVARVVCPYLGQRGLYEGHPDPVIKVKLKPIPLNIPQVVVSENIRFTPKSRAQKVQQEATLAPSPSLSARRGALHDVTGAGGVGGGSIKKLRPVLEHVYDSVGGAGARRHSVVT
ncbi:proline-rich protein 5 [Elysia marginata]|uniref:Proline-rich protein 5 n=1 Tax=Elysia marginata TaxID=1093978 RepID=A0AAV4EH98_9GAST|nr:proline-rich protein 5 [Elysia marginata]